MNILINFFASLYDLVIDFFASLYDAVYNFIVFLGEYIKWATTIEPSQTTDFSEHTKQTIPVRNEDHRNG